MSIMVKVRGISGLIAAFSGLICLSACQTSASRVKGGDGVVDAQGAAAKAPNPAPLLDQPAVFDCANLDFGIYWYGPGNTAQKATNGTTSVFFDPSKPTVIYAHGWQKDSTKARRREDFLFKQAADDSVKNVADAWLTAGWNVGIFYWNQFADEDDVRSAESKIWGLSDPTVEAAGMRWRQCDGSFSSASSPEVPVGELFLESYRNALAGYQGSNIRLVGHSLGNQVVTRLAGLIADQVASGQLARNLLPTRVALMDPWWSMAPASGHKMPAPAPVPQGGQPAALPPLVPWHGPDAAEIVRRLVAGGMIFERYQTSDILELGSGDPNQTLTDLIGIVIRVPTFISTSDLGMQTGLRHVVAPRLYFQDFAFPPPMACDDSGCGSLALSSSVSDERARELMQRHARWQQNAGEATVTPVDDRYQWITP